MVVKELMSTNVCFLKENACLQDAAALMRQYEIGFLPICSELGEIVGVVTDRDLITKPCRNNENWLKIPIEDVMTREVFTLTPDLDIHQAALCFSEKRLHRLPVVQGTRLIGILSVSDLAKKRIYLAEVGEIIGAITTQKNTKKNSKKG